jgi:Flp pilus assembly protein TadD
MLRVGMFLFAIVVLCRFCASFRGVVVFGLAFFVLNLLPILGLVDMYFFALSPVSDHLQYLALPGLCVVGGSAFAVLFKAPALRPFIWLPASGFLALMAMFGYTTYERSTVLARDESVWLDTVAKNPAAWLAHNNLGCILAERQDFAGAEQHFMTALKLNPRDAQANCNYGRLLALKGDLRGAEEHYCAALEENSRDAEILKSFASTLLQQGRAGEALPYLRKAVEAEPSPKNRLQLANALQMSGATREAVQEFKLVLGRDPNSTQALNNLAWLLATSKDASLRNGREAVSYAEKACKLTRHDDPMALGTLASAYAECGRFPDAVRTMDEAIRVAEKQSKPAIASMGRQIQTLFKSGKPFRQ